MESLRLRFGKTSPSWLHCRWYIAGFDQQSYGASNRSKMETVQWSNSPLADLACETKDLGKTTCCGKFSTSITLLLCDNFASDIDQQSSPDSKITFLRRNHALCWKFRRSLQQWTDFEKKITWHLIKIIAENMYSANASWKMKVLCGNWLATKGLTYGWVVKACSCGLSVRADHDAKCNLKTKLVNESI